MIEEKAKTFLTQRRKGKKDENFEKI